MVKIKTDAIRFLAIAVLMIVFAACGSNRQKPISDLRELCAELTGGSAEYSEDDWASAKAYFDDISGDIEVYRTEYTQDELNEISQLKGECTRYFAHYFVNSVEHHIGETIEQVKGGLRGVGQTIEEKMEKYNQ